MKNILEVTIEISSIFAALCILFSSVHSIWMPILLGIIIILEFTYSRTPLHLFSYESFKEHLATKLSEAAKSNPEETSRLNDQLNALNAKFYINFTRIIYGTNFTIKFMAFIIYFMKYGFPF